MTAADERPHVDTLSLTDTDTFIYETVATLEYTGQPTTRGQIGAAVNLDEMTIDATLDGLTWRGMLIVVEAGGDLAFEPARRGWSAVPDQGRGM